MIMDKRTEFASASTSFQNETGTKNVGDIIDMGHSGRDLGNGQPVYLIVSVDTAADGGAGSAGTMQFSLVSDSTDSIATDGTQTIHLLTKAHVAADLTQGDVFVYPVPAEGLEYERYLAFQVVQGGEGEDDMIATAWLSLDPHGWKSYADATN